MVRENKFEGWAAVDDKAVEGNLKWISYTPKTFCPDDIEGALVVCPSCEAREAMSYD